MNWIQSDDEIIYTKNLLLRKFKLSDADDMLTNWIADADVQSGYGEPVYTTKKDVDDLLLSKWLRQYRWAMILRSTNENIGHISFCIVHAPENVAEVEYCVSKRYWGQGLAPEGLAAFLTFTFHHTPITKIEAFHRVENPASGRVLQKAGMKRVDNILRFAATGKAPEGSICYAMTKDQQQRTQ